MIVLKGADPNATFGYIEFPKAVVCNDPLGSVPRVIDIGNGKSILKFRVAANDIYGSRKSSIWECEVSSQEMANQVKKWIIPGVKVCLRGKLKSYVKDYKKGGTDVVGIISVTDFLRMDIDPRKKKEAAE